MRNGQIKNISTYSKSIKKYYTHKRVYCHVGSLETYKINNKKSPNLSIRAFFEFGAEKETRTLDPNLGKVMLYQLSYSRIAMYNTLRIFKVNHFMKKLSLIA